MKKYFLSSLVAGLLLIGGGCSPNHQTDLNNTSTTSITPTTPTTTTITSDIVPIPTSTPTLIDKPISAWPRYEFKELGFSIQLPFEKQTNDTRQYLQCSGKDFNNDCWPTTAGKPFVWFVSSIGNSTLTAASEFYNRDTEWSTSFIRDFYVRNGSYYIYDYKINPLSHFTTNSFSILVFNASKDIYSKNADPNYGIPDDDVTAIIRLPHHLFFKAAVLTFPSHALPLESLNESLKTIRKIP